MSRWLDLYTNHPFQAVWNELKENVATAKIDDETVLTSVKELARLKKVVAYIDGLLNSIDPARVGRNNQRALRRMLASHPVQCATLIAPYATLKHLQRSQNENRPDPLPDR